jgi:hypothetical protein
VNQMVSYKRVRVRSVCTMKSVARPRRVILDCGESERKCTNRQSQPLVG